MTIPRPEDCMDILRNAGCGEPVIQHCIAVRRMAMAMIEVLRERGVRIDEGLIEVGALLHDIGRATAHGPAHALEGGKKVKEMGWDDKLVRLIEVHIGAGLPKEEATALGLPEREFLPETIEEKIVAHADNLVSDTRRVKVEVLIEKLIKKGKNSAAFRVRALHDELSGLCGKDVDDI